jgi:uncharacterized protein Usg
LTGAGVLGDSFRKAVDAEGETPATGWEPTPMIDTPPETDLARQLRGYRLTTAEIVYRRPDHPSLLQEYIWQELDIAPGFPVLTRFLRFWEKNLEGRLHSITVASVQLIRPAQFRWAGAMLRLH